MFPTDVVIVAGARTPMARYTGVFSEVSAIELGAHATKGAVARSGVDPGEFDHVVFGNVIADEFGRDLWRAARWPEGRIESRDSGCHREPFVWLWR